jgi:lysophospholipase L1-like esterase
MNRFQANLILILLTILLFLLTIYRFPLFMEAEWGVVYFKITIVAAYLLLVWWLARVLKSHFFKMLGVLLLLEGGIYAAIVAVIKTGKGHRFYNQIFRRIGVATALNINNIQFSEALAQYDSTLFYTLKPLAVGSHSDVEFNTKYQINSKGLRDDEASLKDPTIVVLGDSHTMGLGVEQAETYPQLLEKAFQKPVLNAGISSYGTVRQMRLMSRLPLQKCQWLVIQYCNNDYSENLPYITNNHQLSISTKAQYERYKRENTISGEYYPFKWVYFVGQYAWTTLTGLFVTKTANTNTGFKPTVTEVGAFADILEEIQQKYKGNILVIGMNFWEQRTETQFLTDLNKEILTRNIKNVNLINATAELTPADFYPLDGHPNASGHQKVAKEIESAIHTLSDLY